jgi:sodium transport system permease protein
MNWKDIRVLYLREIRSALRDRTIVTNSILLPIFLYPVMMWLIFTGFTFISGQNEELKSRIMLKDVPAAHAILKKEFETDKSIVLTMSDDAARDIRNGVLDALVEFLPPETDVPVENNFETRITYDESRDQSNSARLRVDQKLSRYRETYLEQQASRLGLSREQFQNFWVDDDNVSSNRQMGQFIMGLMLPVFFIVMLAVGGMHPAIDATAGERENSTWETVMSAATSRSNVLVGKYLYVATMAFTAAVLNLIAMMFSMGTILAPLFAGGQASLSFRIPFQSVPVILMGAVLLALFVSAGMMILASFARNYKEGQSMISPFYIALILPILFLRSPGLEFTPRIALIPVANVTMMIREAIQGIYHWRLIGLTMAVEAVCVVIALRIAMMVIQHEDFVMGSYSGSFGKFARERLLRRGNL